MESNSVTGMLPEEPAPLEIRLFGPPQVRVGGVALARLRSRKGFWLLALLALRADRGVERAWLLETLWPDSTQRAAGANLRNTLLDLRHVLGVAAPRLRSPTPYSLALDLSGAFVDVRAFDRAIARGDDASLAEALDLYLGPVLEGCAEPWAFEERQTREQAYLAALETLAARARAAGNPAMAERHLRRAVLTDPMRETAQRGLMDALAADGNVAAALRAYEELRLHLRREMDAEPDPATTEAHLFISDLNQSPFNVGTRLELEDFTREQVADLNRRYRCPLPGAADLDRFFELVSGHPYLVRRGLHEMSRLDLDVDELEAQADRDHGIFGDHLRRLYSLLIKDAELCAVVRGVLQGEPCPTAESFYRLRAAGVLAGDTAHDAAMRCRLYQTYLSTRLQ